VRVGWLVGVTLATAVAASMPACQEVENAPETEALSNSLHTLPFMNSTPGLEVHAVRSIRQVIVHRIAVMPLIDEPDVVDRSLPTGAAGSITAQLYARANVIGGWEVVPQDDVDSALQQMPPTTPADMDRNALELGRKLSADGVIYGSVHRYRERVGFDYAAQKPAAVAFVLKFVDENSKQVVWTARFAREQKSLAENVFDLPNFLSHGGRWVRARDIAAEGVQSALANLQSKLTVQPVVQGK
jgi:hypothetical protein